MIKKITQRIALPVIALLMFLRVNAQNYEWIMGNDPANFPVTSGYAEVITINGLTIVPKNPMEGTIPNNMGATNASAKTFDGISYINRFQFNGAGYSSAKATDAEPLVNMPTQRYLQFDVTGPVKVSIVGTSGSSSETRKIFLTDGTDLIGSFDYPDANLYKPSVTYTGDAATLYLFCNAACNIYHIIVEGSSIPALDPEITSFTIDGVTATIDSDAGTIAAELPAGTDLTAIEPVVGMNAGGKSYEPAGAQDFTNPVIYTVFNADKSKSKVYTVTLTVAVTLSNDATLKEIKYKGSTIADFVAATTSYTIELPYGSAAPETDDITAATTHPNAVIGTITRSSGALPTDILIPVTAEDGTTKVSYIVHFIQKAPNTDATLKSLSVNGKAIFEAGKTDYTVEMHPAASVPEVKASATDSKAKVEIINAADLKGKTIINVTAEDGVTKKQYTVGFDVKIYREFTQPTTCELTKEYINGADGSRFFMWSHQSNWQADRTYCTVTGDFPNMSAAERTLTITVKNVYSFDLSVHNSTAGRIYYVKIGNQAAQPITHNGGSCETQWFVTNSTGELTITVSGDNGSVYPAKIVFYPPSNDATLKDIKYKGATIDGFAAAKTDYAIELPYGSAVPAISDITAATTHANANIGTTIRSSDTFPTIITIPVTAEDKTTTRIYTLRFTEKPASTDATLKSLKVDEIEIALEADKLDYTVDLPHTTTTVPTVGAEVNDPNATLSITQSSGFQEKAIVDVTAEDGITKKQYTVGFSVFPSITSFVVDGVSATIDNENETITVELPANRDITAIESEIEMNVGGDHYTPEGAQDFTDPVIYTVYNADESKSKEYMVTLTMPASDDATLSDIRYRGVTVDGFTSAETDYNIELPYGSEVPAISDITATTTHSKAEIGTITRSSDSFPTEITIPVTAENETTRISYILHFTRATNTDATLKSLIVNGIEILEADKLDYIIDLPHTTTTVPTVEATAIDSSATILITPASDLQGKTIIDVTAEDGVTKIQYSVAFSVFPSITSFVINDVSANIDQENGTITAELPVGTDITAIEPEIEMNEGGNHYTPEDVWDFTNPVTYTVYNTDESKSKTYTVTLTVKVILSDDATLCDIRYKGVTIDGFASAKTDYTVNLPYGSEVPTVIDISAATTHENATVGTITCSSDTFPTIITIPVTAEDRTTTEEYTITFNESPKVNIKDINDGKEIKSIGYYDLMGRPVAASTQGVVLVKTVYTDGTSTTSKTYRLNK